MKRLCRPAVWIACLLVVALSVVVVLAVLAANDDDRCKTTRKPAPAPSRMLGDTVPMPVPRGRQEGPYKPYEAKPAPKPAPRPVPPPPPAYRLKPMAR